MIMNTPTVNDIIEVVAKKYSVPVSEIIRQNRKANIASVRMIAMYMARKLTSESYPEIGSRFFRNHSTIIHGVERVRKSMNEDFEFKAEVDALEREISARWASA